MESFKTDVSDHMEDDDAMPSKSINHQLDS
jgi:hypothetical protein